MDFANHDHQHAPNRFGVIPTPIRLNANPEYSGKGVTIAFLDSGFYPHPDLDAPVSHNRLPRRVWRAPVSALQ